jgi:hypothetical protein
VNKFYLMDTLGRLVTGPMGAPVTFGDREEAVKAALRKVEPVSVVELRVVMDPARLN